MLKSTTWRGNTKSFFSSWQCSITYGKIGLRHVGNTQLGSFIPCGLLARLGSFRLPLACIDGDIKNCWMNASSQMGKIFTGVLFINCPKRWRKCITSDEAYLIHFYHSTKFFFNDYLFILFFKILNPQLPSISQLQKSSWPVWLPWEL